MTYKQIAIASFTSDNSAFLDSQWFAERPHRTRRLREPFPDEYLNIAAGCTHLVVARVSKTERLRIPIVLLGVDPVYLVVLMKDTPKDGVQDLVISLVLNASRKNRRDDLAKIITRASQLYR